MQKISLKYLLNFSLLLTFIFLMGCGNGLFKPADARKVSPDPRERVKKNLEEGKGFRLDNVVKKIGIFQRYISDENETSLDLGLTASKKLPIKCAFVDRSQP